MTGQATRKARWRPAVARRLADAVERVKRVAGQGDRPVVVFDLDNTVVRGDTGSLFYLENATNLGLCPDDPGFRQTVNVLGDGGPVLRLIRRAQAGRAAPEAVRDAMLALYHRVYSKGGPGLAYPWGAQVLSGLTMRDLRRRVRLLAKEDAGRKFTPVWLPNGDGAARSVYCYGVQPYPEVVDLMSAFAAAGAEVHIVTGTAEPVAEEFVRYWKLPVLKVHGMRTEREGEKVTSRIVHPVTVGGSKMDVIRLRIGKRPLFVAGDSVSDLSMMLYADGPCLVMGEEDAELVAVAREKGWPVQPHFDGPMPKPL